MHQVMDVSGAVLHSEREYDIAADTAINEGQVVKLVDGLVVAAAAGETAAVQGPQKDRPFLQIHAHFLLCEKLKDIVLNCRFTQSINCVKTIVKKRSGA